jgi:hypothetical protein
MGLADYAAQHAEDFDRIHAVVEIKGQLLALDLRSESVPYTVTRVTDGGRSETVREVRRRLQLRAASRVRQGARELTGGPVLRGPLGIGASLRRPRRALLRTGVGRVHTVRG